MILQVAKAIIHQNKQFLLQLRDNSPGIVYPNQWSFFGGGIESEETPWQALQRELEEELEWRPVQGFFLDQWINYDHPCRMHLFAVPFIGNRKKLILQEGQAMRWFSLVELKNVDSVVPHVEQNIISFLRYVETGTVFKKE